MTSHKDEAQEMIEEMDDFWWPSVVEAQDGNLRVRASAHDAALADKQRVIDDLAEALSMIASGEADNPVRFAAQALANNGLYTG